MIKKKIIFLIVLQFFFNSNLVYSIENKILYKIDNEIITSIDLEDEKNYLKILNKDINSLGEERIYDIVKSSLIREKIKKIEILKNVNEIKLEEKFFETLLDNFQKRIDVYDKETFYKLLKKESINLEKLKEKFSIEVYWNELIINKFGSKVEINEKKLQNQVSKINNKEYNSFNLSEIIFDIEKKKDLESKFNKIENDIETNGFENSVLIYSLADSKNFNGKLGWINEEEINIKKWLKECKEDDDRRYKFVKDKIKNKTLLDFGCGAGGFIEIAKQSAKKALGVELEIALQSSFKERGLKVFSNILKAQKEGLRYDVITSFHVFEHLRDPKRVILELSKLLTDQGEIIIEVPNSNDALLTLYENNDFARVL